MRASTCLALRYSLFALIATLANLATQDLTIRVYAGPWHLTLAIGVGTIVGLVTKYVLDKRYIFDFQPRSAAHDGRTFMLYTAMGLLTTVIFWGFEFGFEHAFGNKTMRYLGAALGLAIGYFTKYQLDRKFVFQSPAKQKVST